jgi:hypothetical protein
VVVAFFPAVTDASFNDVPSTPFNTLLAAIRNEAGNETVAPNPAVAARFVKSSATVSVFSNSIASDPVAPLAMARAAAPSPTAPLVIWPTQYALPAASEARVNRLMKMLSTKLPRPARAPGVFRSRFGVRRNGYSAIVSVRGPNELAMLVRARVAFWPAP